eukprot:Lankesteria_metandrocarpae@DN4443_c1_g1_i5.p1
MWSQDFGVLETRWPYRNNIEIEEVGKPVVPAPPAPSSPFTTRPANQSSVMPVLKAYQRSQFFKTRICPHFKKYGRCGKADECNYAHAKDELRPSVNLTKTKLCHDFLHGSCRTPTESCPFAHGLNELRSTPGFYKTQMCKFWMAGDCPAGKLCRHAHGDTECRVSFAASIASPVPVSRPSPNFVHPGGNIPLLQSCERQGKGRRVPASPGLVSPVFNTPHSLVDYATPSSPQELGCDVSEIQLQHQWNQSIIGGVNNPYDECVTPALADQFRQAAALLGGVHPDTNLSPLFTNAAVVAAAAAMMSQNHFGGSFLNSEESCREAPLNPDVPSFDCSHSVSSDSHTGANGHFTSRSDYNTCASSNRDIIWKPSLSSSDSSLHSTRVPPSSATNSSLQSPILSPTPVGLNKNDLLLRQGSYKECEETECSGVFSMQSSMQSTMQSRDSTLLNAQIFQDVAQHTNSLERVNVAGDRNTFLPQSNKITDFSTAIGENRNGTYSTTWVPLKCSPTTAGVQEVFDTAKAITGVQSCPDGSNTLPPANHFINTISGDHNSSSALDLSTSDLSNAPAKFTTSDCPVVHQPSGSSTSLSNPNLWQSQHVFNNFISVLQQISQLPLLSSATNENGTDNDLCQSGGGSNCPPQPLQDSSASNAILKQLLNLQSSCTTASSSSDSSASNAILKQLLNLQSSCTTASSSSDSSASNAILKQLLNLQSSCTTASSSSDSSASNAILKQLLNLQSSCTTASSSSDGNSLSSGESLFDDTMLRGKTAKSVHCSAARFPANFDSDCHSSTGGSPKDTVHHHEASHVLCVD